MKQLVLSLFALALAAAPCMAQAPHCTPAPAGLAGWWTFDETPRGVGADQLRGRPGKLRNRPEIVPGRVAGALRFNGADWVDVPGDRLNAGRGDFSLALWIRTSKATGGVTTIIDKRERAGKITRGYSLWMNNGRPGFQLADNAGPSGICSNDSRGSACTNYGFAPSIADGAWHFLAVTVNRGAQSGGTFYVDGREAGKFDPTLRRQSLDNSAPFRIGAHSGTMPHGFVEGCLDEVQFYRRALTAEEVAGLANAGDAGICKNVPPARVVSLEEKQPRFVPGIVVIKLSAKAAADLRKARTSGVAFASLPFPADVRALNLRFSAVAVEPLFPSAPVGTAGGLERIFVLTIDKTRDPRAAAFTYARARGVEYAEPDRIGRIQGFEELAAIPGQHPQWNLTTIGLAANQAITGKGIVVAVLDTGVDVTHPDLKPNIHPKSWDFVDIPNDNIPQDPSGHGTHVAGIIAAARNGFGVTGVAPEAQLMAVRCVDDNGEAPSTGFARCIEYAITSGAHVVNSSWGVEAPPSFLEDAVFYARSRGAIFVAAAGNDGDSITKFSPANAESGITVASTTRTDEGAGNYGTKLDVAAPGDDISSTYPGNKYATESGTSMAAPHVAGLAALLLQARPGWTPEEIRQAIRFATVDVGASKYDDRTGFGRIDVNLALKAPRPAVATLEQPYNGELVTGKVQVFGAAGSNWELSMLSGTKKVRLAGGPGARTYGPLTEVDTTQFPDGIHTLLLTAKQGNVVGEDRNVIIIDNTTRCTTTTHGSETIRRCWPIEVSGGALKSPLVADLDRNGRKEIILGTAVFDADGLARPGWEGEPAGYGRSNPGIEDIDGDGDLEIVAAVWSGLTQDEGLPHGGAPVIRAFDHARKQLWQYEVINPNALDGEHHGVPSTISIADVDGKPGPEIVFTVFFSGNNPNSQTHVFILDAKGKLKNRIAMKGRAMSSVALVPSGSGRLLVIPTDKYLHVIDASGKSVTGWPQDISNGLIDPVVADFDLDGKPEILVGRHLWTLDGKVKAGYPATGLVVSTGSAGQLAKSDCELEVVLGGANDVVYSVSRHNDAKRQFSAKGTGETYAVDLSDDNGSPGVPITADLDGDGNPDIIRPPGLAFEEDVPAKLYATAGMSAAPVPGFPRYIQTEHGLIRSSAVVDDIDNDGKTDLLIAGHEKLYAWSLGKPFNPANNPWPMFQHDLAHTGYLPPSGPTGSDLWIEDTPVSTIANGRDDGSEPSALMAAEPTWTSRAIRVRNKPGNPGPHENPAAGQTNEVLVSVKNRGCRPSASAQVEVWSADASKGLAWPKDWVKIGSATVPPLAPAASTEVGVKWMPSVSGHFCLIARIAGEPMTHAEGGTVETNVRKNNNLAWRRVTAVDLLTRIAQPVTVHLANVLDQAATATVTMIAHDDFLTGGGRIIVNLDGQQREIRTSPATITGIALGPKEKKPLKITIAAPAPLVRAGTSHPYTFDVIETIGGFPIGGASYSITARGKDADTDRDGKIDRLDLDDDNDGVADANDPNPLGPAPGGTAAP